MRRKLNALVAALVLVVLPGCASDYVNADSSWSGGFSTDQVSGAHWRVGYYGNGYTSNETVQTYWLYRAAQLALEQGFDGFGIIDDPGVGGFGPRADELVYEGVSGKPVISADVRLLKKPLPERPGMVFDAGALKAFLQPLVEGPAASKCSGNVCPHVPEYMFPGFGAAKPAQP